MTHIWISLCTYLIIGCYQINKKPMFSRLSRTSLTLWDVCWRWQRFLGRISWHLPLIKAVHRSFFSKERHLGFSVNFPALFCFQNFIEHFEISFWPQSLTWHFFTILNSMFEKEKTHGTLILLFQKAAVGNDSFERMYGEIIWCYSFIQLNSWIKQIKQFICWNFSQSNLWNGLVCFLFPWMTPIS